MNKKQMEHLKILIKVFISILGFVASGALVLMHPIKYWNPDKGEFGTRKISFYNAIKDNPDQIIISLAIVLFIAIFIGSINFMK